MNQNRTKKKIAPWIVALVFIVFLGTYIGILIFAQLQAREVPFAVVFIGLYIVILAAMIVGIIVALRQRLKEIDGGEEDEALQY